MASSLEFIFRLADQMSAPARKIGAALASVSSSMKATDRASKAAKSAFAGISRGAGKAFKYVKSNAWSAATAVGGFVAAGVGAASVGVGLGLVGAKFAVDAASFKRNMLATFELMLGSKDEAAKVYKQIDQFADQTPFEAQEVFNTFKKLKGTGLDVGSVKNLMAGIFDVASLDAKNAPQTIDSLTRAMMKLKSAGKLTGETLEMLNDAGGGIINTDRLVEAIAQIKGVTKEAAKAALSSGSIDATTGMRAFLQAVSAGTGQKGGAVGGATLKFGAGSYEGQISTLKSRLGSLFEDINIEPLIGGLKSLNTLLADDSKEGKELRAVINSTFGGMGDVLKDALKPENLKAFVVGLVDLIKGAVEVGKAFFGSMGPAFDAVMKPMKEVFGGSENGGKTLMALKEIATGLGKVIGVLVAVLVYGAAVIGLAFIGVYKILEFILTWIVKAVLAVVDTIAKFFADLVNKGPVEAVTNLGKSIVDGLWNGIKAAWGGLVAGFNALLGLLPDAVKKTLGIASPSRVMMELGGFVTEGFAIGVNDNAGEAQSAMSAAVGAPTVSAAGLAAGGAARGAGNITINVEVNGGADAAGAAALAQQIGVAVRRELVAALEGAALEVA
jgi:hypothetical protein